MKTTFKQLIAGTFIALLIVAGNNKAEATELKVSGLETAEKSLQIENWMTDETFWETNSFYTMNFSPATETTMKLESWMTNYSTWNSRYKFVAEAEAEMELESWMTNELLWNVEETNIETTMKLESWMVNSEIWK